MWEARRRHDAGTDRRLHRLFRYLSDALTPDEGLHILRCNVPTRCAREAEMPATAIRAYVTSVGWTRYADERIRRAKAGRRWPTAGRASS